MQGFVIVCLLGIEKQDKKVRTRVYSVENRLARPIWRTNSWMSGLSNIHITLCIIGKS